MFDVLNRYRLPGVDHSYSREVLNKACLVVLQTKEKPPGFLDESTAEMRELARAALLKVQSIVHAHVNFPNARYFIGKGKLEQIVVKAAADEANLLVFNVDLSPAQIANIEKLTKLRVIDRTALILEIFGRRAKTKAGKLQVELAQLNYALPRIGGLGKVMSRVGGGRAKGGAGAGVRGSGEQELERDRRKVRRRMLQVKDELKKVRKHRDLLRQGRKRKQFTTIALIGYTNAGKSTLLNALTGSDVIVQDQLFATLDPVTRVETINGHKDTLFVDTVGFLRDLPHTLIESFHATLEEVVEADYLIHVLDVSSPRAEDLMTSVNVVLTELKIEDKPWLLALNKADLLNEHERERLQNKWPEGVLISAKDKEGLANLLEKLEPLLKRGQSGKA